jgi:hypothetical protein
VFVAHATINTTQKESKMAYIIARLKEASTWRGIIAIITACGVVLTPDQVESIIAAGLALMGIFGAFFPDFKKTDA